MKNETHKPTRLRTILYAHVKELNPNANHDKIDALEEDIRTFVRGVIYNAKELGLSVELDGDYIGDFN